MRKQLQLAFASFDECRKVEFGGDFLGRGHPKAKRPLSTAKAMYLVMRSSMAIKEKSLLRQRNRISMIVRRQARLHGIKIYRFANAGNHLHMVIMPGTRIGYCNFVRAVSGLISRLMTGREKGVKPLAKKFWDKRPYTRIVEWGRAFRFACAYVTQNKLEALGFISYQPRKARLSG